MFSFALPRPLTSCREWTGDWLLQGYSWPSRYLISLPGDGQGCIQDFYGGGGGGGGCSAASRGV